MSATGRSGGNVGHLNASPKSTILLNPPFETIVNLALTIINLLYFVSPEIKKRLPDLVIRIFRLVDHHLSTSGTRIWMKISSTRFAK